MAANLSRPQCVNGGMPAYSGRWYFRGFTREIPLNIWYTYYLHVFSWISPGQYLHQTNNMVATSWRNHFTLPILNTCIWFEYFKKTIELYRHVFGLYFEWSADSACYSSIRLIMKTTERIFRRIKPFSFGWPTDHNITFNPLYLNMPIDTVICRYVANVSGAETGILQAN